MSVSLICYNCARSLSYMYAGGLKGTGWFKAETLYGRTHSTALVKCVACSAKSGHIGGVTRVYKDGAIDKHGSVFQHFGMYYGRITMPTVVREGGREMFEIRDAEYYVKALGSGLRVVTIDTGIATEPYSDFIPFASVILADGAIAHIIPSP